MYIYIAQKEMMTLVQAEMKDTIEKGTIVNIIQGI